MKWVRTLQKLCGVVARDGLAHRSFALARRTSRVGEKVFETVRGFRAFSLYLTPKILGDYSVPMVFRFWFASSVWLCLGAGAQIVQPGAPGTDSKTLSPDGARTTPKAAADADAKFMQGMIMHHAQAVEMTALMPTHTHNQALLAFGKRISISQTDEIEFMKQWLTDRGKSTTMEHDHAHMQGMAGMLMPGMLTPQQMDALRKATGANFDRLFLTGMIQHHGGALTMVQDLFDTPGAAQDSVLYDFATDIDNTQAAEIKIMQGMLKGKK